MKAGTKESSNPTVMCREHKEKCVFVCLFKTCKDAFRIGCMRCRKDHAQHPNRLISLNDFHSMLCKPIRYLENLTAFKLMNLKKKIEYIRNFRTEILEKEIQLIDSNKNIKSTISSILEEHYAITDVVSHIDGEALLNNYEDYVENLQKCKDFLAYNPVKCELVFNNDVIKNSRIQLEKHLKTSHELIDNIREFLIKIIEVLMANCAHDEDDDEIEFAEEGDGATTFNIFIKHRTDVTENPNIKSKLEHETFLEMFDEEKEALTKEIDFLEKEIVTKSNILQRIKSCKKEEKVDESISEQSEREESSTNDINIQMLEQLQLKNKILSQEVEKLRYQSMSQISNQNGMEPIPVIKQEFQTLIKSKESEINDLMKTCSTLQSKLNDILQQKGRNQNNFTELSKKELNKYQEELAKEKEASKSLIITTKELQSKINDLNNLIAKQSSQFASLSKKYSTLQSEFVKRKQQQQNDKQNFKSNQEELQRKISEISNKLAKKQQDLEKKEKDVQRQRKKYIDLQKLVQKMKQNSSSIEKESQKWREEYQGRQKYLRNELDKSQKDLQTLKYKARNDDQRNKNLESRIKDLSKEIELRNQIISQKDRVIREKEQTWLNKSSLHSSRMKDLEIELKNSRSNDNIIKNYEEEIRKNKQTKELLEMSIKKNQELKDRYYELETEFLELKNNQQISISKSTIKYESNMNGACEEPEIKRKTNGSNLFVPQQLRIETVTSEELSQSPIKKQEPLKEKKIIINKDEKKLAYLEIKSLFKAVTDDMGILQERLKENSVIQKVYLKQLERKRNENKILKKELENIKVYGGNFKQGGENPLNISHTHRASQKDKKEANSPLPHGLKSELHVVSGKKPQKVSGK